jgi:hypothetical protein
MSRRSAYSPDLWQYNHCNSWGDFFGTGYAALKSAIYDTLAFVNDVRASAQSGRKEPQQPAATRRYRGLSPELQAWEEKARSEGWYHG